jgi:hypothetical protein
MSQYPFSATPGTSGTYAYGSYPPATPGAQPSTSYATSFTTPGAFPSTGVQSYGSSPWPPSYSYFPQLGQSVAGASAAATTPAPRPAVPTTAAQGVASYATTPSVPQRTYTTYNTSYVRDGSVNAAGSGRAGRSKTSHKGLFAKECECCPTTPRRQPFIRPHL